MDGLRLKYGEPEKVARKNTPAKSALLEFFELAGAYVIEWRHRLGLGCVGDWIKGGSVSDGILLLPQSGLQKGDT